MKRINHAVLVAVALALGTTVANAAPQPNVVDGGNRWTITAYNDASPVHSQIATQGICFLPYAVVGTHIRGRWYSDTYPNWNGTYSQEGDQLFMHGDYAYDVGHDGMQLELSTSQRRVEASGHWQEWREYGRFGRTVVFANAELNRVGSCRHQVSEDGAESLSIQPRFLQDGSEAQNPLDPNQLPVEVPVSVKPELLLKDQVSVVLDRGSDVMFNPQPELPSPEVFVRSIK